MVAGSKWEIWQYWSCLAPKITTNNVRIFKMGRSGKSCLRSWDTIWWYIEVKTRENFSLWYQKLRKNLIRIGFSSSFVARFQVDPFSRHHPRLLCSLAAAPLAASCGRVTKIVLKPNTWQLQSGTNWENILQKILNMTFRATTWWPIKVITREN